jgi:hypothetical protein
MELWNFPKRVAADEDARRATRCPTTIAAIDLFGFWLSVARNQAISPP